MGFAIYAKIGTIRINAGDGIIQLVHIALKKADGQHNSQLLRQSLAHFYGSILCRRLGVSVVLIASLLTKIRPLPQLRQQHQLRSLCCSLAYQRLSVSQIIFTARSAA